MHMYLCVSGTYNFDKLNLAEVKVYIQKNTKLIRLDSFRYKEAY